MTTNKSNRTHRTLSSFSVAAIALLAAAAPAFAQTAANEASKENPTGSELALASSKTPLPAPESIVATSSKESTRVAEAPAASKLSAASFNVSSQFVTINQSQVFSQQIKTAAAPFSGTKRQFNSDEYTGTERHKRLEFVPSKGQPQPE